jgi:hypothetical protein
LGLLSFVTARIASPVSLQQEGFAKKNTEVWGVSKGGSQKYKDPEAEYRRLTEDA